MSEPALNFTTLRLGHWYSHHLQLQATCQCGRVSIVHRGSLIVMLGDEGTMNKLTLQRVARAAKCVRCGRREPELKIVVKRD